jgi:hypothetical protein
VNTAVTAFMPVLVLGAAVFFTGMGVVALARPAWVQRLFGTIVTTSDGRNEVRAVYGGYGVAMGALLVYSLGEPRIQHGIWLTAAAALVGMVLGRIFSFALERKIGAMPLLFLLVELVLAAVLGTAAFMTAA